MDKVCGVERDLVPANGSSAAGCASTLPGSTLHSLLKLAEGEGIYYPALEALIFCRCYWLTSQADPAAFPGRPRHVCVCVA